MPRLKYLHSPFKNLCLIWAEISRTSQKQYCSRKCFGSFFDCFCAFLLSQPYLRLFLLNLYSFPNISTEGLPIEVGFMIFSSLKITDKIAKVF